MVTPTKKLWGLINYMNEVCRSMTSLLGNIKGNKTISLLHHHSFLKGETFYNI